jgi:hypothetical protein
MDSISITNSGRTKRATTIRVVDGGAPGNCRLASEQCPQAYDYRPPSSWRLGVLLGSDTFGSVG